MQDPMSAPASPAPAEEVPSTPSLTLPADVSARLKGDHQCKPGDRYTLTVAVRSVGEDGSLTLDVPEDATFAPAGGGPAGEAGEESLDRFSGPKPMTGVGKSLADY